ncbi:MAG TPA: hypothetical protein DC054_06835 [Blastocatellia bacterium]|nr:hypothetical protein [Blastocatellia bacterium]
MAKDFSSVKRLLSFSRDSLRESLFRNIGVPYRNIIGLLLGFTASFLPLITGVWIIERVIWVFVGTLALTIVLLVVVRPNVEKDSDRFAWGLLVIIILGFALGALIYQAKPWWIWLWHQYLRINEPHELLLEALFLLGVIMGFFVVRNWGKEQKDFISSLSGVLGGAFVATILGDIQKELTPLRAFAYYALGFTISGSLNLISAARLTATYANKGTLTSRAILDFLYGTERTKTIDGYFLEHFEEDKDYAKMLLLDALNAYRTRAEQEFADKFEARRRQRQKDRETFKRRLKDDNEDRTIEALEKRWSELEPSCGKLKATQHELKQLEADLDAIKTSSEPNPADESRLHERSTTLKLLIERLERRCSDDQSSEWKRLNRTLASLKPSYYYQLIAIENHGEKDPPGKTAATENEDPEYSIIYQHIGPNKDQHGNHGLETTAAIHGDMFRVGVAIRQQDVLEYLLAPGAYRAAFPCMGSVAGLALLLPHTIIMNRDMDRTFRSKDYKNGIRPKDIEQGRGRDIIDYLSYVSIPLVSHLGTPKENRLGIVNIDTKLFVTRSKLGGEQVQGDLGIFRVSLKRSKLEEFANNLYEHNDEAIGDIEKLTETITPVLELYSKCRIGAT